MRIILVFLICFNLYGIGSERTLKYDNWNGVVTNGDLQVSPDGVGNTEISNGDLEVAAGGLAVNSSSIDASSILDVVSTTKGARPHPSMDTTARGNIASPVEGLGVWDITTKTLFSYNGSSFIEYVYTGIAQILTNKTIDGDDNTVQDLALTSLKTTGNLNVFIQRNGSGVAIDSAKAVPTGDVVGTTDTQTLTNKTIAGGSNTISGLTHGSQVDNPSSGVHGVTGSVVGTTDTQTLSNKDFSNQVDFLTESELRFQDNTGGEYVGFKAGATVTSQTYTWPGAVGAAGQILSTDASGVLSWITDSGAAGSNLESYNWVLNGDQEVWQRGVTFPIVNIYTSDRFLAFGGTHTTSRVTSGLTPGSGFALRMTRDSGTNITARTGYSFFEETVKKLRGKEVTLSIWYRVGPSYIPDSVDFKTTYNTTGEGKASTLFSDTIIQEDLEGGLPTTFTEYTVSFTVNTAALGLSFSISSLNDNTSGVDDYVDIAKVKLAVGDSVGNFTTQGNSYEAELLLCKVYYAPIDNVLAYIDGSTATAAKFVHNYEVEMHHTPTITISGTITSNQMDANAAGPTAISVAPNTDATGFLNGFATVGAGATVGKVYKFVSPFTAEAEL